MTITEPITMLTDYVIAVEVFIFAIVLFRKGYLQKQVAIGLWAAAFACVGVAAALGGTCHGFTYYLENSIVRSLWSVMLLALSSASLFMLFATIISTLPRRLRVWFLLGTTTKFCLYLSWSITHLHFVYAIVDYLSAMLIVLGLEAWAIYRRWHSKASVWIIAGILVSGLAIGVQAAQLTIAALNSNDLYHVVQVVALYLLYRGASKL